MTTFDDVRQSDFLVPPETLNLHSSGHLHDTSEEDPNSEDCESTPADTDTTNPAE